MKDLLTKHGPYILDTTLRDGEQMPGVVFSAEEKIAIAALLDRAGVHEAEIGTPAMGTCVINEMATISTQGFRFKTVAWCRANKGDIDKAVRSKVNGVHISFPVSAIHLKAMGKSETWILTMLHQLIPYACERFEYITIGAQDASRADYRFLREFMYALQIYDIKRVRIADTVGILNPFNTRELISALRCDFPLINLEFHGHNDLGMATANSVAAFMAGAVCINTTVNGLGERAGNTPLDEFIMAINLSLKSENSIDTTVFSELSEYVSLAAGIPLPVNKPVTGSGVLSHESGIHTNLILKDRKTYQLISAESIGKHEEEFIFGKHSGFHAFRNFLERQNMYHSEDDCKNLLDKVKSEAIRLKRNLSGYELLSFAKKASSF